MTLVPWCLSGRLPNHEGDHYARVHGVQEEELLQEEEQEEYAGQTGAEKILQVLQEAYAASRDQIEVGSSIWQSSGLQNRRLQVRVLSHLPKRRLMVSGCWMKKDGER